MTYKVCTGPCAKLLPVESFGVRKGVGGKVRIRERCKSCHTKTNLENRKKNGRKVSVVEKESSRKRASKYYYSNKELPSFKSKRCFRTSVSHKQRKKASPNWLTPEHKECINYLYWLAKDAASVSGESYHVDHIVPIKGVGICGLHVPWNLQILPADMNMRKSNKHADFT